MKRFLSLALVLVLVFSAIMPSFAEVAISPETQDLVTFGIIEGDGTSYNEEAPLTRAQMAKILAFFYGEDETAATYAFAPSFTDMEEDAWYLPWVAYAEAQGWMIGDGANSTFRPNEAMKAQEANMLMLRVLGYGDTPYAEATTKAAELGVAITAADNSLVLRGEAFKAIRTVLDATPMDAEMTLGSQLELPGYVSPEPPVVEPVALEVESVEALNLIQVQVKFNQAVTAATAETVGNYSLTDVTAGAVTVADADLQEDEMTVVLTLDVAAAQQDVVEVTIEDVATADDVVVADTTIEDVTFFDTIIPTVVDAINVGNDTIKVVFSEPMNGTNKANFEVTAGNKLFIKSATLQNNNTEALVELYTTLEDGTVDIKVLASTEDYAGFGVKVVTETVVVSEDTTAPVVTGYKDATPTGVTLIWSEDIEITTATAANYYHTNSGNPIDANLTTAEIDGNEMTLKFTSNELPQGTAYVYVLKESVNDLWDNENAQQMIAIEVELDTIAPAIDGDLKVNSETQVQFNFTEDMNQTTLADEANYTLLDEDGEELALVSSASAYDSDTARVNFSSTLNGQYALVIENLEDLAGNTMADITIPFTVADLTAPDPADFTATIYNPGAANQMIRINFADIMATEGAYSILDATKYAFNNGTDLMEDLDPSLTAFTVVNDGKSLEIVIPSTVDDPAAGSYVGIDLDDAQDIIIAKIADAAGNKTDGISVTLANANIEDEGTIANPTVKATGTKTVVMTFAEQVTQLDLDDFEVQDSNVAVDVASVSTSLNSSGNTVVTFKLVNALSATANGGTVTVEAIAQDSENSYGEPIAAFEVVAADAIAPTVDKIVYVNDSLIQVHLTEDMDAAFFAPSGMNGFTVADATGASLNTTVFSVIDIVSAADFTINTNVSYNGTSGLVDDNAGNALAAFTRTDALTAADLGISYAAGTITVDPNYVATAATAGTADVIAQFTKPGAANVGNYYVWVKADPNFDGTTALDVAQVSGTTFSITATTAANASTDFTLVLENADGVQAELDLNIANGGTVITEQ